MEELVLSFAIPAMFAYPLFLLASLKKSLSYASKSKVSGVRTLACLVVIFFETMMIFALGSYIFISLALPHNLSLPVLLPLVILVANYTIKAMFVLSLRRGVLAFLLWQALSIGLGALFVLTILAATFETMFTMISIIALMLLLWWMWSGKPRIEVEESDASMGARDTNLSLGESEKKIAALAIIVLLFSTLVTPSMVRIVYCEPQPDSDEYDVEVEVDFDWANMTVRGEIAWSGTVGANISYQQESSAAGQAPIVEFAQGLLQGGLDTVWGIVNVPGALQSLHDAQRDLIYADLINDVTSIQSIIRTQSQQDQPRNPLYGPAYSSDYVSTIYAKDEALANRLANMERKEFKVHVAENPESIERAVDIEKYVETVSWGKAILNFVTLNIPLAIETYQRVASQTGDWKIALYEAARVFGLTAPALELVEAARSGDPGRIGKSIAQAVASYGALVLAVKAARNIAKLKGYAESAARTLYNFTVGNFADPYNFFKGVFSGLKGLSGDVTDEGLGKYLSDAFDDLIYRFRERGVLAFEITDEGALDADGLANKWIVASTAEEVFAKFLSDLKVRVGGEWRRVVNDPDAARRFLDVKWLRSFIDEILNYQRLREIGEGEVEVRGARIKLTKGIWRDEGYFNLELLESGTTIRVYEDSSIARPHASVKYGKGFDTLDPDDITVDQVALRTIIVKHYLEKVGFFEALSPGNDVEAFGVRGVVDGKGKSPKSDPYVDIKFEVNTGDEIEIRVVKASQLGLSIFGRRIEGLEIRDDGAVYLHEIDGKRTIRTPMNAEALVKLRTSVITDSDILIELTDKDLIPEINFEKIKEDPNFKTLTKNVEIESFDKFVKLLANNMQGDEAAKFKVKYGKETYKALVNFGNSFFKSVVEKICEKMDLRDYYIDIRGGVEPNTDSVDAVVLTKGKQGLFNVELFKIEFKVTGQESCSKQLSNMRTQFREGNRDIGIILGYDGFHLFLYKKTTYQPLANLAKISNRKIPEFMGVTAITSLDLLTGYISGAEGDSVNVTDDAGRWLGMFQGSNLHLSTTDGSGVFNSRLSLTSVEDSTMESVNSTGSTVVGSFLTLCNISAKLLYSIMDHTLAVCSTIFNSVINSCRILNSTLVNVLDLVGSHVEDSSMAYSAGISNCIVIASDLMSVVNLSNTTITNSNLTLVANVDNTKIDNSDISYSANISRSEIINAKLVGCTVQASKLMSCTAVDTNFRNVNAINTKLTNTNAENSNLANVNATNANLTNANVEYSNLENVELKNVEVLGTDMKDVKVVDKTVVYGRVINSNGDLDPLQRAGTPNYSGRQSTSTSTSKTSSQGSASSGTTTKGSTATSGKTSSSSGQTTQTSNQTTSKQSASTTSQQEGVKPISRGAKIWIN